MKLIFERSRPGRGNDLLPSLDVPAAPCRRSTGGKRSPACRSWGRATCPATIRPSPAGPSACATASTHWAPVP